MMIFADPRGRRFAALALLSLGVGSAGAETGTRADAAFRLDEARRIAGTLVDLAVEKGRSVSVVVVNREGRIILSQRMDDASFVSLQLAEGKAMTAAAIGVPTKLLEQQVDGGKASVLSAPGVIAIAGGVPVTRNGKVVAAIGVSGAASDEDDMMATAARDAVMK
ncbi:MAG: GlcG/HbpS family heme-binding protein [Sphingobium sp.]